MKKKIQFERNWKNIDIRHDFRESKSVSLNNGGNIICESLDSFFLNCSELEFVLFCFDLQILWNVTERFFFLNFTKLAPLNCKIESIGKSDLILMDCKLWIDLFESRVNCKWILFLEIAPLLYREEMKVESWKLHAIGFQLNKQRAKTKNFIRKVKSWKFRFYFHGQKL